MEKIEAIVFNPGLLRSASPKVFAIVGFSDGSRLSVKHFKPETERVIFSLSCGVELISHPDEEIWSSISSLQSFGPHVKYLTELAPAPKSYRHTPLIGPGYELGENENVLRGMLRASGKLYPKGPGHAQSFAGCLRTRSALRQV